MASRRWLDWDIIAKMLGGLVMMAIPAGTWFIGGWITRGLFVMGALGIALFCWGLFAIGDSKSEWE